MPYFPPPAPRTVPRLRPANWYNFPSGGNSTVLLNVNEVRYGLFALADTTTFTQVGVDVSTAGSSTALVRFGIYNDAGGFPGTLVQDFGQSGGTGAVGLASVTVTFTLAAGVWWAASVAQGSGTMPTTRAVTGFQFGVHMATTGLGSNSVAMIQGSISAALPASATPVAGANLTTAVRFKTA